MSGTHERLMHDNGAYETYLRQSTGQFTFVTDPTRNNRNKQCFNSEIGYIGSNGVSLSKTTSLPDIESELRLLNYPLSKDPREKYRPFCDECNTVHPEVACGNTPECVKKHQHKNLQHFDDCNITTDYSRLTNPVCNMKGVGVNRFAILQQNPQERCRWEVPCEVGINNRMVVLDNHVPCIPTPLDDSSLRPQPQQSIGFSCAYDTRKCQPYYGELHPLGMK